MLDDLDETKLQNEDLNKKVTQLNENQENLKKELFKVKQESQMRIDSLAMKLNLRETSQIPQAAGASSVSRPPLNCSINTPSERRASLILHPKKLFETEPNKEKNSPKLEEKDSDKKSFIKMGEDLISPTEKAQIRLPSQTRALSPKPTPVIELVASPKMSRKRKPISKSNRTNDVRTSRISQEMLLSSAKKSIRNSQKQPLNIQQSYEVDSSYYYPAVSAQCLLKQSKYDKSLGSLPTGGRERTSSKQALNKTEIVGFTPTKKNELANVVGSKPRRQEKGGSFGVCAASASKIRNRLLLEETAKKLSKRIQSEKDENTPASAQPASIADIYGSPRINASGAPKPSKPAVESGSAKKLGLNFQKCLNASFES